MNVLDLSYGMLFEPARTLRQGIERPPLLGALVIILISLAVSALAGAELGTVGLLLLAAGVLLGLLGWFARTAVWHLASDLVGGEGTGRALLAGVGLAQFPRVLAAPASLLALAGGWGVGLLFSGLIGIWVLWLSVLAVRETQNLGTGTALAVVILPYVAIGGLVLLFLVMLVVAAFLAFPMLLATGL